MSGCAATGDALTLAGSLRGLDCQTGEAVATVFGRLFGPNGQLLTALTVLLTLYVALFAIALLSGRTRIGIGTLTPRMMTLGLVLTFATSWAAYQNVVWTLATGAPDEIARAVTGSRGSATADFADRLDGLFAIVADAADQASQPAPATETGITPPSPMVGGFTASTVLWLAALMLLLGSVGVLVTAKIALAALLAIGPLFIVLALFGGTRGLFEGWLKALAMFALAPLFAVLIGGGAIAILEPVADALAQSGSEPSARLAGTMFVGAAVFVALMIMALKTAATIVSGWRLPGSRGASHRVSGLEGGAWPMPAVAAPLAGGAQAAGSAGAPAIADERIRGIVAAVPARGEAPPIAGDLAIHPVRRSHEAAGASDTAPRAANTNDPRSAEFGRRFRAAPDTSAREKIS